MRLAKMSKKFRVSPFETNHLARLLITVSRVRSPGGPPIKSATALVTQVVPVQISVKTLVRIGDAGERKQRFPGLPKTT